MARAEGKGKKNKTSLHLPQQGGARSLSSPEGVVAKKNAAAASSARKGGRKREKKGLKGYT